MREIKFRAWIKDYVLMADVNFLNIDYKEIVVMIDENDYEFGCGEYELMQYTGLKDKNGKEIYEGDILEGFGREDFRMKVIYREPSFSIEWFDKSIRSIRQLQDGTEPIPHNIYVTSEVIGNIYENPELLEVKK